MMIRVFWLMRFTAFAVFGIAALISPPHSATQRAVLIACFSAVGVSLLAWTGAEAHQPHLRQDRLT